MMSMLLYTNHHAIADKMRIVMANAVNLYAAWQPVRVFAGLGTPSQVKGNEGALQSGGFFINGTGLQWGSLGIFPGWIGESYLYSFYVVTC